MIYLKVKKNEFGEVINTKKEEVEIDLYEDMFFSTCPKCGKSFNVDFETIKALLADDGDFSSTSLYCDECSKIIKK